MSLTTVAIVGRPNVGKSTLFNALIGRRKSIVSHVAGTTRDRVVERVSGETKDFWLVDTAGLTNNVGDSLEAAMQMQAQTAIANADALLFVLDGRAELTQEDYDVVDILRKCGKPVVVAVNKVDDGDSTRAFSFAELGLGVPISVSGKNFVRTWELTDQLEAVLPPGAEFENETENELKLALIGRPNVGKSTLLNRFLGHERSLVSEVAGTTRDTIDALYTPEVGDPVRFLDTAGLRRPGKIGKHLEYWSAVRTRQAIEQSDVCALIIDSLEGITHQDKALVGHVVEAGKGLILVVNKFDLVYEKARQDEEADERDLEEIDMWGADLNQVRKDFWFYLKNHLGFVPWAPVLFMSGLTGKGTPELIETARGIVVERHKRIGTSDLNRYVPDIQFGHVQPSQGTKLGKIKYLSQVDTNPPKFIFHVNNAAAFHWSYRRYAENKIREKYGFHGTPITVEFRDSLRDRDKKRQRKTAYDPEKGE